VNVSLRSAHAEDASVLGRIDYEAFKAIADQHNFPPDYPSVEVATMVAYLLLSNPGFYGVVAELDGKVVGSNFLDERGTIAGIGPVSVDPAVQNQGIGRTLMLDVMERARRKGCAGMRLVQLAYHNRSLCLYSKLGFDAQEELSTMQGQPPAINLPGYEVRPAVEQDVEACNRLCETVHGHHRSGELRDAIRMGTARVVEHLGRVTGYCTSVGWMGHAVGESNNELKALIDAAKSYDGPGFLCPTRNGELMRWCLEQGLRNVHQATLMTIGLYNAPRGAWLPAVLY
jgi:predicted N-acetyltransferase YhbS